MVLHELCHLYHDQGLGGENNQIIKQAYQNAKKKNYIKPDGTEEIQIIQHLISGQKRTMYIVW